MLCAAGEGDLIKVVALEPNTTITYQIPDESNNLITNSATIVDAGGIFAIESATPII